MIPHGLTGVVGRSLQRGLLAVINKLIRHQNRSCLPWHLSGWSLQVGDHLSQLLLVTFASRPS